jgi:hypothetical protein
MSFDRETRNKLAHMVGDARRSLVADVTDNLRRLGLQDDGTSVPLSALPGLSDADKAASEVLRELLTHFAAQGAAASETNRTQAAHARLVREIGFTTLNRLVALRMAEERGLIIESVRNGLSAAGFQLFERIANSSLGARAEAYRAYVECLYDELAVDLPSLFSRTNPESLVFPSEPVLEQVLGLLNDPCSPTSGRKTRPSAGCTSTTTTRTSERRCATRARRRATVASWRSATSSSRRVTLLSS